MSSSSSLPQPTVMQTEQNGSRINADDHISEQSNNNKNNNNSDERSESTIDSKNVSNKGIESESSSKFPVKIQFIDNRRGRGVIATRSFTTRECILATVPTISVLYSSHASKLCAYCFHEIINTNAETITMSQSFNNVDEPQQHVTNSNTERDNKSNVHDGVYRCPTCDQFVLCARCVSLAEHGKLSEFEESTDSTNTENNVHDNDVLVKSVSTDASVLWENANNINNSSKYANLTNENTTRKLENTFVIKVHNLACSWYNELPESVRAPGQDTDMLRFCLQYGARVYYNDKEMQHEMMALDSNESALSLSTRQFCEIFARDRIVATFSAPYSCHSQQQQQQHHHHQHPHQHENAEPSMDKLEADRTSHEPAHDTKNEINVTGSANSSDTPSTTTTSKNNSVNTSNNHVETNLPSTIVDCADTSSLHFIRYPVLWEELNEVLMRVQCNSLGFPFNTQETTGWSLQDMICMLNHSCVPNAAIVMAENDMDFQKSIAANSNRNSYNNINKVVSFDLIGCMGLKTIQPISEGEEITISYINMEDYADDVEMRQRHLLEKYRFLCSCPLCLQQRHEQRAKQSGEDE